MAEPCVVCGSTSAGPAFAARDWSLMAVPDEFRYMRCSTCRCVRIEPQPDDELLGRCYVDAYVGAGRPHEIVTAVGDRLGRPEARRVVSLANPVGAALDAGCGDGAFLLRLAEAGWKGPLLGLEPGRAAAARARSHGFEVEEKAVEQLDAVGEFDLVVLRHVIEHVRSPRGVLERVRRSLRPGGLLYLGTPDERALSARVFGRYWHGWDPPRHLWILNPEGVRRVLRETGFELVAERWGFAPEIWTASLGYALSPAPGRARILTSNLNPFVALPAAAAAGVEVLAHRSTMYAVAARASGD
jgi:SAM-dependent methyltransferase